MTKKFLFTLVLTITVFSGFGQTLEELKAEQAAKKDSIADIQSRVDALQDQIDALPGWKIGAFGTLDWESY